MNKIRDPTVPPKPIVIAPKTEPPTQRTYACNTKCRYVYDERTGLCGFCMWKVLGKKRGGPCE